jgi:predicted DNA-binding mobile mystery protein A
MGKKNLQLQQLSRKMESFNMLQKVTVPPGGWIKAIRAALGISAQQLGYKLSVTRQNIHDMETREKAGAITLKALQETARALNMRLVYGFVPDDGTLEALIERKARELAQRIIARTATSMVLEDQGNSSERLDKAIEERTAEIKREMPKALWD